MPAIPPSRSIRTRRARRGEPRKSRGQSLVEFALILPLMFLLLAATLDLGRVYLGSIELQNAARIAANYAARHADADWTSTSDPAVQQYRAEILNETTVINCSMPTTAPSPAFPDGNVLGGRATVGMTCNFSLITPILSNVVPNPLPVSASAAFPIRSGRYAEPVATPLPTPAPTPTPTSTPTPCTAPDLHGQTANQGAFLYGQAGFTGTYKAIPGGQNFTVARQDLVAGQPYGCSTNMTVWKNN